VEVKRGDVFLVDLNPVVGTEQAGIRPALVVQTDRANVASPHTIIIPFTARIREAKLPSHVRVPAGTGGLTEQSVLLCEQIRVIDKRRLVRRTGHIEEEDLRRVDIALKLILGLE
jgi:mRNA interferase MazF